MKLRSYFKTTLQLGLILEFDVCRILKRIVWVSLSCFIEYFKLARELYNEKSVNFLSDKSVSLGGIKLPNR